MALTSATLAAYDFIKKKEEKKTNLYWSATVV